MGAPKNRLLLRQVIFIAVFLLLAGCAEESGDHAPLDQEKNTVETPVPEEPAPDQPKEPEPPKEDDSDSKDPVDDGDEAGGGNEDQDPKEPEPPKEPEKTALEKKLEFCFACHGKNGVSEVPPFPNLAAQQPEYLLFELQRFKSEYRKNPLMKVVMRDIDQEMIEQLAEFFSSLDPDKNQPAPRTYTAQEIEKIAQGKKWAKEMDCERCHNDPTTGNRGIYEFLPSLAGQEPVYFVKQINDFKNGNRPGAYMPRMMNDLARYYKNDFDQRIEAISLYYRSIRIKNP